MMERMGHTHEVWEMSGLNSSDMTNEWVKLTRHDGKNGSHSSSVWNEWVKLIKHDGMNGLNSPDIIE